MIYCHNPDCIDRQNTSETMTCKTCNTTLFIKGRYQLIKPLRKISISMGAEVFTVQDLQSTTKVMKILRIPNQKSEQKLLQLFDREAQALRDLDHQGIPKIETDGYFSIQTATGLELKCLVMEKIAGVNLEQWLQENHCCTPDLALQWLKQIVDILEHLHQHQLFHRDIKPTNIMLRPDGQLALIDFGAVRQISTTIWNDKNLTAVLTPGYAPPEQLNCQAVPQSDFYALGRTFVHLLTGKHPLDSAVDIHGHLQWRSNLPPYFPKGVADLVDNLMAPLVTKRPKCAATIRRQLQRIEKSQSLYFLGSSRFLPKWLNFAMIIKAVPLIISIGAGLNIVAWWCFNNWPWHSIEPVSPLVAKSLVGAKKNCALSTTSKNMPLHGEWNRSSNSFDFDKFISIGDIFYVEVPEDNKSSVKFDLKQEAQDENFNYYDRTMIKDMGTGFYIYKSKITQHPLYPFYNKEPDYPVYVANPRKAMRPFKVKFCRLDP
jgi:serine/threonine protein kinase